MQKIYSRSEQDESLDRWVQHWHNNAHEFAHNKRFWKLPTSLIISFQRQNILNCDLLFRGSLYNSNINEIYIVKQGKIK